MEKTEKNSCILNSGTDPVRAVLAPMRVGPVTLPNGIGLAPLAGVSELAFRKICSEMGAGLVVTELVSAKGIRFAKSLDKQLRYLAIDSLIQPTAIQLFGSDPDDFSYALDRIFSDERCRDVAIIDINMGCPVPKVVKSGAGCALLLEPERAKAIVRRVKSIVTPLGKACTIKTRIGFDAGENCAASFCRQMAEAGAEAICLHARTRKQMYSGQADWGVFSEVRSALGDPASGGVPLFANGDIVDGVSARLVLESSAAAGLMIGRAAMGNPWIFSEVMAYLKDGSVLAPPSTEERARVGLRHSLDLVAQVGEEVACRELRKTLAWYAKGLPGATKFRRQAAKVSNVQDLKDYWDSLANQK